MQKTINTLTIFMVLATMLIPPYTVFAQEPEPPRVLQQIIIQPDENSTLDTHIFSDQPNTNFGTGVNLSIGESNAINQKSRALLGFNLSTLPKNILIESATLYLTSKIDYATNDGVMQAYAIPYINNAWWWESGSGGATWNNARVGQAWSVAGAWSPANLYMGEVEYSATMPIGTVVEMSLSPNIMLELVKNNYAGFLLKSEAESDDMITYHSSASTTSTTRPKLVIQYYTDEPIQDLGWYCTIEPDIFNPSLCAPRGIRIEEVTHSPYFDNNSSDPSFGYELGEFNNYLTAAKIDCEPYPFCADDFPVYFEASIQITWHSDVVMDAGWLWTQLEIVFPESGYTIERNTALCGGGTYGGCTLRLKGKADVGDIGTRTLVNKNDVVVRWRHDIPVITGTGATASVKSWSFQVSRVPIVDTCADEYIVPVVDTYNINPTVELPQGQTGTPPDNMTYTLAADTDYRLKVYDGPWNDGTMSRYDSQVSFDAGTSWMTLEEWLDDETYSQYILCWDDDPNHPELKTVYFTVPEGATMLFIRAADAPGQFADNEQGNPTFKYSIGVAWQALDEQCGQEYLVPVMDTYVINPTIETPVGDPLDKQIYTNIVIGQIYMVRILSGPWNDGTVNRWDTEVSKDGIFWDTLANFAANNPSVVCVDDDPQHPEIKIVYFEATTTEFHIRVNDEPGQFADNTNSTPPLSYAIGIAFELPKTPTCDSQFSWNAEDDWEASLVVQGNDADGETATTAEIVAGDWYVIQIISGAWHETSGGEDRKDLEIQFYSGWNDLALDVGYTDCVSADGMKFFVQAPNTGPLSLRVNSESFADNTGSVNVNIYHADYEHISDGCAIGYAPGQLLGEDTVAGNASNGKSFATYPEAIDTSFWETQVSDLFADGTGELIPGGEYMLETTNGPWYTTLSLGDIVARESYYTMQIKVGAGDWEPLETWSGATCIEEVDPVGHLRVFFTVPEDEALLGQDYRLRVASNSFPVTRGQMGWKIYQATDVQVQDGTCADYVYNPDVYTPGRVNAKSGTGDYVVGLAHGENPILEANYFAIEFESSTSGWYELANNGGLQSDAIEITDDGSDFDLLPNSPKILCYYNTPVNDHLVIFIRVLEQHSWKLRVNSSSFDDNSGYEDYKVYPVSVGELDDWTSCIDEYTPSVPALNENEWIPVKREEGVNLMPTLTYSEKNDPDGDGYIYWGEPGLQADKYYMVETANGPWTDGDSPDKKFLAQLSNDGGDSWQTLDDNNTMVICADVDQLGHYYRAIFKVTGDQKWKIRVADTATDSFTDNGGSLAYRLSLVNEFPIDGPGDYVSDYDPDAFDVCTQSLIRPTSDEISVWDIGTVGMYVVDWIRYFNRSMLGYFAWCPRHTDLLISAINALWQKEPLATIAEFDAISRNVHEDFKSYDWSGGYNDDSIFNVTGDGSAENLIEDNILRTDEEAWDPWSGDDPLVTFDAGGTLPTYYYDCNSVMMEYIPEKLTTGVCFTLAYWRETGVSFWVQMLLDLGVIFMTFYAVKDSIVGLVKMMSGVAIWQKTNQSNADTTALLTQERMLRAQEEANRLQEEALRRRLR